MSYLKDDFLLTNKTAERLYFQYAQQMPIFDYHCHLSEQQILENLAPNEIQRFKDLSLQQGIEANLREGLPQYIQNDINHYKGLRSVSTLPRRHL